MDIQKKMVIIVSETRWRHRRVHCSRSLSSKGQGGQEIRKLKKAGNRVRWEEIQNDTEVETIWNLRGCGLHVSCEEWCHSFWKAFWVRLNSMRPLDINYLMLTSEQGALHQKTGCEHFLWLSLWCISSEGTTGRRNWKVILPQFCSNCITKRLSTDCLMKDRHLRCYLLARVCTPLVLGRNYKVANIQAYFWTELGLSTPFEY